MIREADRLLAEAIGIVAGLYRDKIIPKSAYYTYPYPDLLAFHDAPTSIEQKLYLMFLEHRMRTFQGSFHANPDYAFWYGWSGPPGGRPGLLRSVKGRLRAAPRRLLAAHRPHGRRRAVRRPGFPVPQRRFLPRRGAENARRRIARSIGAFGEVRQAGRNGDSASHEILRGRGLPPGLLQEEPVTIPVLPVQFGPRHVPEKDLGR